MKKIVKIVITGGPCAGKTLALKKVKNYFEKQGIAVLIVQETATDLILGGVSPLTLGSQFEFQKAVLSIQIAKEDAYFKAANSIVMSDSVLVVCDRGLMDGKVYLNDTNRFDEVLKLNNITEDEIFKRYDAIFHLVTAADGAENSYNLSNNLARTETIKEAIIADNKSQEFWSKHSRFEIIDNSTGFDEKLQRLISKIDNLFYHCK